MSDIRSNIHAMLQSVAAELAQVEARHTTLVERKRTLEAWLSEEGTAEQIPTNGHDDGSTPLSAFLRRKLSDGRGYSVTDLGAAAFKEGLIEGDKSPGRVVHFALLALEQHGIVRRKADKTWVRQ